MPSFARIPRSTAHKDCRCEVENLYLLGHQANSILRGPPLELCPAPRTPLLSPLDFDEEISPIFLLSPSWNHDNQLTSTSGGPVQELRHPRVSRPSSPTNIRHSTNVLEPVQTRDIADMIPENDHGGNEVGPSATLPTFRTPTVDITDKGIPLPRGLHRTGHLVNDNDNHPSTSSGYPPSLVALSAIPIYHGQQRRVEFNSSPPYNVGNSRYVTSKSIAMIRKPATRERRPRDPIKQPIELTSPSMTPSPTCSATRQFIIRGPGGEGENNPLAAGQVETRVTLSGTKAKIRQRRSLGLRAQPEKRWSTKHELTQKNTVCNPFHTPISKISPLSGYLGYPL